MWSLFKDTRIQIIKQVSISSRLIVFGFCFLNLAPTIASAEDPYISTSQILGFVSTDLTGNGREERVVLYNLEDAVANDVVLSIWNQDQDGEWSNAIFAEYIAQNNGQEREPTLSLAENGSVEIHSYSPTNASEGWEKTLTIAYRQLDGFVYPEYLVVGITFEWEIGEAANNYKTCSLNLLTKIGEITYHNTDRKQRFNIGLSPQSIDVWPRDMIPQSCF